MQVDFLAAKRTKRTSLEVVGDFELCFTYGAADFHGASMPILYLGASRAEEISLVGNKELKGQEVRKKSSS